MKNAYWLAIAAGALVVGLIVGYAIWGSTASALPEMESELAAAQARIEELKAKVAATESNLGRLTNEKLSLEQQNAELKELVEQTAKKRR